MEKIKSVLHAHKKDDTVAHDAHTSSSAAEGQQHPIYDQMSTGDEGRHTGQPTYEIKTTSGAPYTELAQPSGSAGLHAHDAHGRPAHVGTHGPVGSTSTAATGAQYNPSRTQDDPSTSQPLGSASTATGHAHRPDAYPHGHTQEPSVASIKSGVIGFGAGENQGHAAMSTHNPTQEYLSQDQVVGGGDPRTAGMTEGRGVTPGQTHPQPGAIGRGPLGSNPAYTTEHQPYDNTLRQESYIADTDRSFPLAGGVISKPHDESASTRYPTEHTSSIHNKGISEREPGTEEKEVGIHNSDSPARDSYGRGGLAGAAAAATAIGASKTLSRSEERDVQDRGLETRQATYGDVPPAAATTTTQAGNHSNQSTSDYQPGALAAATVAASRSSNLPPSTQGHEYGAQDINPSETTHSTIAGAPTTGMSSTGERPLNPRLESHRHIPGEYIATPSDEKTFLNYAPVIQPTSTDPDGNLSNVEPTSTLDPSHVQSSVDPTPTSEPHELRHTGTLEEPQPKPADEHHYGRDAAIAGGLGAGAVGAPAYAASKHDTQDIDSSQPLYEESSPYSSKILDPRVLGGKSRLEEQKFNEQRFDPQAKTEAAPSSGSAISGPPVSHDPPQTAGSQHHYGRNAAVLGTGAAAAGGMHHALNRNDTPSAGTAVLPDDPSYTSTTGSNVAAPQPTSNFSKPLPTASTFAPPPVGNDNFYGATGAPAPIPDTTPQQPSSNLGQAPVATTVSERQPEHHYGRDAGLAGAGAAAAAGGLYAANRDNTDSGPASSTIGPHSSNTANIMDPRVQPDPSKQIHHNVGPTAEDPASRTIGPHDSNIANILDPRVKPDPSKQKEHTTVGPHQSDTLNRLDPKVDEKAGQQSGRHYGRDAAAVGGAGAAGYGGYKATNAYGDHKMTQPGANEATPAYGNQSMIQRAYEAINAYGDHKMTQPAASMPEQRYDPTATSARAPNPVSSRTQYDYNDPTTQSNVNRTDPNDHINRNAALGGAGLAAAGLGAGAYAGSKHNDNTTQLPLRQKQDFASSGQPAYPIQGTTQSSYPMHGTATNASYPASGTIAPHDTHAQNPAFQQPHGTRDPTNEKHDKRNAAVLGGAVGAAGLGGAAYANSQNQDEREAEERLKKIAHDKEKEQHRLDKEQHKHDKEVHKHDKALAAHEKDEHRLAKEHEKEQARLAKEHEKEQARLAKEQHQREKELEKENEGEEKKKGGLLGFLHRDKSKKEKSPASPESSPRQSRDYSPRHSRDYGDDHPDSPRWKGKHLLHKDPPKGHPAREAMEHQHQTDPYGSAGKREHVGTDGPIGDPNMISGDRETRKGVYGAHPVSDLNHNNTVTEPHTGLPMNIERFGTGAGGTDGNPTIHGQHQHGVSGATSGQSATDWEAIRKADTPY